MCRFLESICFKDGTYQLLELHQQRINKTFANFFTKATPLDLGEVLPNISETQKVKVRLEYEANHWKVQVNEYMTKSIKTLRAVPSNDIDYHYKFADRDSLNRLFAKRFDADDILIIKDGWLTDSYYANVILKKDNDWVTPKTCLLNGIKRQWLLDQNMILEEKVSINDIKCYSEISLINAMLDPGDISVPVSQVILP